MTIEMLLIGLIVVANVMMIFLVANNCDQISQLQRDLKRKRETTQ